MVWFCLASESEVEMAPFQRAGNGERNECCQPRSRRLPFPVAGKGRQGQGGDQRRGDQEAAKAVRPSEGEPVPHRASHVQGGQEDDLRLFSYPRRDREGGVWVRGGLLESTSHD